MIAIILLLVSILFIGGSYYKKGSDRAACLVNINQIHKTLRAVQNLDGYETGEGTGNNLGSNKRKTAFILRTFGKNRDEVAQCPTVEKAYKLAADRQGKQYWPMTGNRAGIVFTNIGVSMVQCPINKKNSKHKRHDPLNTIGW